MRKNPLHDPLERYHSSTRMSQIVTFGDMVYLAGQVSAPDTSVTEQTQSILAQIDDLLAEAGSDKEHILQSTNWLASMDDFAEMNAV
ncbi:RidA family protein [Henriciella sp. AS95]